MTTTTDTTVDAGPERSLQDSHHRYNVLGDLIGVLLDQAGIAVTVHTGPSRVGLPTYGLARLAEVLDLAGLIDDTRAVELVERLEQS
ncbi:hypothetical protein SAMN05443637_13035 [Pseudonocardia thermophila]|jgi:hypothetical protein|uniref:Uncharacterized protein n=1 Tax=Pseudonocardia thermophila TaxID=1848 RepID=A0A1M7AVV3_PSETH|nr:hypothetical protein [Pseudonocardia thermophila]SHL46844.1 hypothetical protein SAMN05443637_13035 [Pseudonocardia thermophila]